MKYFVTVILLTMLHALPGYAADTFSIGFESGRLIRQYPDRSRPVVGLALSGGGARGAAHLGVIDVLTSQGITIDRIAGTSMGSIIGGLVAAGYDSRTLEELLETTDWSQYFSNTPPRRTVYLTEKETVQWPLFDLRFEGFRARIPSSLSAGQRISSLLTWLTATAGYEAEGNFDRLAIPFRAVATDLTPPGNSVVLDGGNLSRAIQASATVPLLFTPVTWDDMALVDGGLTNNLPVDVAREMGSDVVIGVAIDESMHPLDRLDNPLNIADQATSILMRQVTNQQRPLADLLINPNMRAFSSSDFSVMDAMIDQGRSAAWEVLPELRRVLAEAADSCRTARITSITVMPEQARGTVLGIMAPLISEDGDTAFGAIVSALEQVWDAGSYLNLQAVLDDSGGLTVQATPLPRRMVIEFYSDGVKIADDLTVPVDNFSEPVSIDRRIELMLRQFRADGHSLAHVNGMVHDRATDTWRIIVDSPVIARIDIAGRIKSREALITRELQFDAGDEFNLADLMNTVENLYGTNLFEQVYADIEQLDDGVGIRLHVVEKNWSVVRLGMRYDETNEAEGRVTVSRENLFGIGADLSVLGQWGGRKRLLLVDAQNDRVYKSLYSYNLKTYQVSRRRTLYADHEPLDDYRVDRYGTVFSIGQQMERLGTAMLQFKAETVWVDYPASLGRRNVKKEFRSIIAASVIDSYDQYPFPYQGYTNVLYIESANDFFGGTEQYVKLYWGGSAVVSSRRKHALIGRFSLGSADRTTPLINSFTLGGNRTRLSVYDGFSGQSLFYSDFHGLNTEERYGNYLAVGSLSYRLFIPRYFYLTLSWQIGNVWDNNEAVTARSLLQAYGIEGDFSTFLGPIGAGWGVTSGGDERLYLRAGWEF